MSKKKTTHHRKPRSLGGSSNDRNLSEIPHDKHVAWHLLFINWDPFRIAEEINAKYLDPDYEFVARRKKS